MTGDGREVPPVVELTMLDNRDLTTKNRKMLLVECQDVSATFEFPFDAAVRNPDGMRDVTAALVAFVRGALHG